MTLNGVKAERTGREVIVERPLSYDPSYKQEFWLEKFPVKATPRPLEFQRSKVELALRAEKDEEFREWLRTVLHHRYHYKPEKIQEYKDKYDIDLGDNVASSAFYFLDKQGMVQLFQTSSTAYDHSDLRYSNLYRNLKADMACLMSGHVLELDNGTCFALFDGIASLKDWAKSMVNSDDYIRTQALEKYLILVTMSRRAICVSSEGNIIFPQLILEHLSEGQRKDVQDELERLPGRRKGGEVEPVSPAIADKVPTRSLLQFLEESLKRLVRK